MKAIIDARVTNNSINYMCLNLCGNIAINYPIQAAIDSGLFEEILLLSNDKYLVHLVEKKFSTKINVTNDEKILEQKNIFIINGRAVMLKSQTLRLKYEEYLKTNAKVSGSIKIDIQNNWFGKTKPQKCPTFIIGSINEYNCDTSNYLLIENDEALMLYTKSDFELAIILMNKRNFGILNKKYIIEQIEEKKEILRGTKTTTNTICLIGHSLFGKWKINELNGHQIQNCGINGISSIEYKKHILDNGLFFTNAKYIIVWHGTNDLENKNLDNTLESIDANIKAIRTICQDSKIYLLSCLHINGRLDRNNIQIDKFNEKLKDFIENKYTKEIVEYIKLQGFDDAYGNLDITNSNDGLHLSENGYKILENNIKQLVKNGDCSNE